MKRTDWLDGYSGETSEELLSYPAEGQHDSLVRAFEQGIQRKAASKGGSALTNEESTVLAVRALQREVNNGGFDQFFRNSSRQFAPIIVDSLMRIGCELTAKIARRATDALHIPILSAEAIRAVMAKDGEARDLELELCDQLFYKNPEKVATHLYTFIKENKTRIRF